MQRLMHPQSQWALFVLSNVEIIIEHRLPTQPLMAAWIRAKRAGEYVATFRHLALPIRGRDSCQ